MVLSENKPRVPAIFADFSKKEPKISPLFDCMAEVVIKRRAAGAVCYRRHARHFIWQNPPEKINIAHLAFYREPKVLKSQSAQFTKQPCDAALSSSFLLAEWNIAGRLESES